jgi:hypothetical protein
LLPKSAAYTAVILLKFAFLNWIGDNTSEKGHFFRRKPQDTILLIIDRRWDSYFLGVTSWIIGVTTE